MSMYYPPYFISLSVLFWGWRSGAYLPASALLILVVVTRVSPWRWMLERTQYHRLGDLTTFLLLGTSIYFVLAGGSTLPVYSLLRWLPVLACPLLLAQLYSGQESIPLSALFYSLRRQNTKRALATLDFRIPYGLVCLLGAGTAKPDDVMYGAIVSVLIGWILWNNQPRRVIAPIWLSLFLTGSIAGYVGQKGLTHLQDLVEQWTLDWLSGHQNNANPYWTHTAIGDVGQLKLSGRIIMELKAVPLLHSPLLLKEAAYEQYTGLGWIAKGADFAPYSPVHPIHLEQTQHIDILRIQSQQQVLLPVPSGWRDLILPIRSTGTLMVSRFDTIQWQDAPPILRYQVVYNPTGKKVRPPTPEDTRLSPAIKHVLEPLVQQLRLSELPPNEAIVAVKRFFALHFSYSLNLGTQKDPFTALSDFLYHRQSGHCEYFATATALLLRAAGIPSRFISGYSVDEYDPEEKRYVVRSRHAHAWNEIWHEGAWETVDNTPSVWAEQEAESDPWWQSIADKWSHWVVAFRLWQWEQTQNEEKSGFPIWGWLLLPLSSWLIWRLYRSRQKVTGFIREETYHMPMVPEDSEYGQLERELVASGYPPRTVSEPPLSWLRRIKQTQFEPIVMAYYRVRYRN